MKTESLAGFAVVFDTFVNTNKAPLCTVTGGFYTHWNKKIPALTSVIEFSWSWRCLRACTVRFNQSGWSNESRWLSRNLPFTANSFCRLVGINYQVAVMMLSEKLRPKNLHQNYFSDVYMIGIDVPNRSPDPVRQRKMYFCGQMFTFTSNEYFSVPWFPWRFLKERQNGVRVGVVIDKLDQRAPTFFAPWIV